MEQLVDQYFGNANDYFMIKQQDQQEEQPKEPQQDQQEQERKVYGWNSVPNPTDIS